MRKIVIIVVLLMVAVPALALPFVPLLIPAWILAPAAAFAVTAAVGGLYYGMNSGAVPYVDVGANIKRASSAIYAHMVNGSPVLATIAVDAKLTYAQLSALATAKPTTYPLSKALLLSQTNAVAVLPPNNNSVLYPVGTILSYLGTVRTVTFSEDQGEFVCGSSYSDYASGNPVNDLYIRSYVSGSSPYMVCKNVRYMLGSGTAPTPVYAASTPLQVATGLAESGTSGPVKSTMAAELDAMLKDADYVPSFSDTTTGLPWLPPSGVLSPADLAVWNANGAAQQEREIAQAQADAAAFTATQGAQAALARSQAADVILAADPSNPVLKAEADRLRALSNTAATTAATTTATAAGVKAQNVTLAAAAAAAAAVPAPTVQTVAAVPALPALKTVNFAPFLELMNIMSVTYPFNLPTVISSYYSAFSGGATVAPVFDLPLPLGQSIHADLSVLDPVAKLIRYMIGILVTVGMLFYIIHFFRGIS